MPPAATALPATRRCTPWARSCGTAATRRRALSAADRERRTAPAGLRRHRADVGHRHARRCAPTARARGQRSLRHQRPEDLDLARRAFRPDAAARAHDAEASRRSKAAPTVLSVFLVDMRLAQGATSPSTDPHHDEPRHHADVLRRSARAGGKSDRRGRARASATSSSGMNAERILIAAECIGDAKWFIAKATRLRQGARACSAGRSGRTRACSSRSRAPTRRCAPPS